MNSDKAISAFSTPIETLKEFIASMNKWELDCIKRSRRVRDCCETFDVEKQLGLKELKGVFKRYCTSWENPKRAEGGGLHYSKPPEYNPDTEQIISVNEDGNKAKIVTQQNTGFNNRCVYRMVRTADGWRIEDNRTYIDDQGVENPWTL